MKQMILLISMTSNYNYLMLVVGGKPAYKV